MRTIDSKWRWPLLLSLAAVVLYWSWAETVAVMLIMLAPVVRLGLLVSDPPERRYRVLLITPGIALALAFAVHLAQVRLLEGFIEPVELLWTAWFFAGCLVLLEGLDRGLAWAVRSIKGEGTRSLIRLVIIAAIVAPAVVALMQTVRPKIGYTLPDQVQRLDPTAFETRTADGLAVRGFYFDRGHDTTLVIAHGLGAHAENFMPFLLPLLHNHEVNGVIFDFRGHGRSDGHVTSFGYHERKDLQAVVDWLAEQQPAAAENLIFYGFSMGSAATIPVAAGHPNTRGVIIDSGFARLTDVARAMVDELPPVLGPYVYYTGLPLASAVTAAPLHRIAPVDDLAALDAPLRVLHGGADRMIPADQGRQLLERSRGDGRIVGGAGHTALPQTDPAYFEGVGRFIEQLLDEDEPSDETAPRDRGPSVGPRPAE